MADKYLNPGTDPGSVQVQPASVNGGIEFFPVTRAQVTPLVEAQAAFKKMYDCIIGAQQFIYLSAWYLQTGALINGIDTGPSFKEALEAVIKKNKSIKIRILISYLPSLIFPGALSAATFKKDMLKLNPPKSKLKPLAIQIFEHPFYRTIPVEEKDPTPAKKQGHKAIKQKDQKVVLGTSHDKIMIVDGRYGFCGGIEFTLEYNKPIHRHDIHSLIEGPAVSHLEQHFVTHWMEARVNAKPSDPDDAGDLSLSSPSFDAKKKAHVVQLSITKSKDGMFNYTNVQQDIFETYKSAIQAAKQYIYIENQYFRDIELAKIIEARIAQIQELRVIIVLPHAAEEAPKDPVALALTEHAVYVQSQTINYLRTKDPDRKHVEFFSLVGANKSKTYVHAKIMIVDDKWFTIGSANANPRSFYLDAETNISVRDNTAARDFRLNLWKEHFGQPGKPSTEISKLAGIEKASEFLELWKKEAIENAKSLARSQKLKSQIVEHKPAPGVQRKGKAFEPDIDKMVLLEDQPGSVQWPRDEGKDAEAKA